MSVRPSSTATLSRVADLGVRTKVVAAVLLTAVVAVVVGVVGLRALSGSADRAEALYADNVTRIQAAADMRAAINGMQQSSRDAVIAVGDADTTAAIKDLVAGEGEFQKAATRYAAGGLDPARQAQFDQLQTDITEYVNRQRTVMGPLAHREDREGWIRANDAMIHPITDAMNGEVAALVELEQKDAAAAAADTRSSYESSRTLSLVLLIAGVALALGLGWVVATALARKVGRVRCEPEARRGEGITFLLARAIVAPPEFLHLNGIDVEPDGVGEPTCEREGHRKAHIAEADDRDTFAHKHHPSGTDSLINQIRHHRPGSVGIPRTSLGFATREPALASSPCLITVDVERNGPGEPLPSVARPSEDLTGRARATWNSGRGAIPLGPRTLGARSGLSR